MLTALGLELIGCEPALSWLEPERDLGLALESEAELESELEFERDPLLAPDPSMAGVVLVLVSG
jgi:hypothetical protein